MDQTGNVGGQQPGQRGTLNGGQGQQPRGGQPLTPDEKVRQNLQSLGNEYGVQLNIPQNFRPTAFETDVVHRDLWEVRNNPQVRQQKINNTHNAIGKLTFLVIVLTAADHYSSDDSLLNTIRNIIGVMLFASLGVAAWLHSLNRNNNH